MKFRAAGLVSLLILHAAAGAFCAPGDGLEGTTWKYRQKGAIHWLMFWQRDYLVFQDGNFMQARLAKRGYSPTLYSAKITGHGVDWSCSMENSLEERTNWNGTRVSYWMNGTYTQTKLNGSTKTILWKAWQIFPKPPAPQK